MADVVCLGQFTADVVVTPVEALPEKGKAVFVESISLRNGGCACNTAVALGKLGIATAAIGKVGADAFGDFLLGVLKEARVETSGMIRDPAVATSSTAVLVSSDGERFFLHYFGANAAMSESEVDYERIRQARVLHVAPTFLVPGLDGEPMARVLARAQTLGVTTSLDTAWDASGRWMSLIEPCLRHVDVLLPSLDEARMLTGLAAPGEIAARFLSYGIKTVVIKLGAEGCYARTAESEHTVPAFKVEKVADTLGAGDAFVAGFLAATVKGWKLPAACRLANAVGACSVSARGASRIRTLEETVRLYRITD